MDLKIVKAVKEHFGLEWNTVIPLTANVLGVEEYADLSFGDSALLDEIEEFIESLNGKKQSQVQELLEHLRDCKNKAGINTKSLGTTPGKKAATKVLKSLPIGDLKLVNSYFTKKWAGTDMEKYLRAETLFNGLVETRIEEAKSYSGNLNGEVSSSIDEL